MSADTKKSIPLGTLVDGADNLRNVDALIGEANADPRLRRALARELAASRDKERERAAPFRSGRATGEGRDEERQRRERIRKLGIKHPTLTAKELYKLPDARAIGVTERRFANILSAVAPRRARSSPG